MPISRAILRLLLSTQQRQNDMKRFDSDLPTLASFHFWPKSALYFQMRSARFTAHGAV
jgi:hypothetical protein